jgi:putative ATP-binding cassette transporter
LTHALALVIVELNYQYQRLLASAVRIAVGETRAPRAVRYGSHRGTNEGHESSEALRLPATLRKHPLGECRQRSRRERGGCSAGQGGGAMNLLRFLLRSSPWLSVSTLLCSVCAGFASTYLVGLVNELLTGDAASRTSLAYRFAGASVALLTLRWASHTQFVRLAEGTLATMRARLSAHFARMDYRELELLGSARVHAILTEDVATVAGSLVSLPEVAMSGAVVLGSMAYLASLSWRVFLCVLGALLLGSLAYHYANVRALVHLRKARLLEDDLFRHFRALVDGAKELKLHRERLHDFLRKVLEPTVQEVRGKRTLGFAIGVGATSSGIFLFFAIIGVVSFFGHELGLEPRVASGYALIFLYVMRPLEGLLASLPYLTLARVSLERITGLGLSREPEEPPAPRADMTLASLRLARVQHRYERDSADGVFTLGPLDLELTPGEITFLVGGNGSGKTTLAKILVGLYEPDQGEIHLNGERVQRADLDAYRQNFSSVFSDFFLFDSLLGSAQPGLDERARRWLRELQLDHRVQIQDGAIKTAGLSHGQRKRLALLVACLEDRPIYVFDEWAADQDPTYREVFYRKLLPDLKARGKALVVITHDDRYFHLADRCLELEAGKLAPRAGNGAYAAAPQRPARPLQA